MPVCFFVLLLYGSFVKLFRDYEIDIINICFFHKKLGWLVLGIMEFLWLTCEIMWLVTMDN